LRGNEARFLSHVHILTAAMLMALLLVWLSPDARGVTAGPEVDEDPGGAPYAAGELLVTYEPQASEQDVDEAVEESDARVEEELPTPDAQLLSFPEAQDETTEAARERELREAKEVLERDPDVMYVDYNYLLLPAFEPDDPWFTGGSQWNLRKIGAPDAWDTVLDKGARVAVVDSGIAADHPDLSGKIAAQKDVVDNDDEAEDSVGHGTHVAGTVAAATDNGEGVAAVCPSCKLLIARSGGSSLLTSDVVQGIYWSVDNRAKVINLSLGSYGQRSNVKILEHAVDYAWEHGVVLVAAAGNKNTDRPHYPSAYERVISVAATNDSDVKADFSNYGKIDVAAPGVGIPSTVPRTADCDFINGPDNVDYCDMSGTSMASPHVAALAGLLAAQGLKAPEIRRRIEKTAVDLGKTGKDRIYGWGRINAERAVIKR
jgi:thermitase